MTEHHPRFFTQPFEGLHMSAPRGHEEAIVECVERNVSDVAIKKIEPEDDVAYAGGDYEGRFRAHVFRSTNGGSRDGIITIRAYKSGGEWHADHINTTFY
jgi:hypothetical protein